MDKRKYSLEINWNTEELVRFLKENKIKMLNYLKGRMDSDNKVICGDGIDAMASLIVSGDRWELFMIDPPYNENKSAGKYKDQWRGSGKDFLWAGENHGAYMDYLYPRIILGREGMTEDGLIMLFIGVQEAAYVRILLDKVFGEGNYIGEIPWESNWSPTKNKLIDRKHEYVFIYAKNKKVFEEKTGGLFKIVNDPNSPKTKLSNYSKSLDMEFKKAEEKYLKFYNRVKENGEFTGDAEQYKYIDPVTFEIFCSAGSNAPDGENRPRIPLLHPKTKKPCPVPDRGWRFSVEYLNSVNNHAEFFEMHDGKFVKVISNPNSDRVAGILFGKDETTVPRSMYIHHETSNKVVLKTTGHVYSSSNKKEGVDPKAGFETVKPYEFIVDLITHYQNKSARVLDSFGGSGTLAVAVKKANEQDQGTRQWTMIELNEDTVKKVMIPKLEYFKIEDFKQMNVSAINLGKEDVDKFFRQFLLNYIQSEREYSPIEKESSLGYTVIGVEKDTLILSTVQKTEDEKSPRPSAFAKEIAPYLTGQIKKIYVYLVGSDQYRSAWDALVKDTVVNKANILAKDIKIAPIQHELKAKWEGLIDTLSQYDDTKKG